MGDVALLNNIGSCLVFDTACSSRQGGYCPTFSGSTSGQGDCTLGPENTFSVYVADDATGIQYVQLLTYAQPNSNYCLTALGGSSLGLASACMPSDANQQFSMSPLTNG